METVHIGKGKETLAELPKPPRFLSRVAKGYFNRIGEMLIKNEVLKDRHLLTLEMLATNCEQWEWSVREINRKNKLEMGSGFVQTFASKATNISTEVTLKRDAEKAMRENISAFGMDPQSEKKLKRMVDPNQGSLFDDFNSKKHG